MSQHFTIYTSLPPNMVRFVGKKQFEKYQEACIISWKYAGFRVVSVNSDLEIQDLRIYDSEIDFLSNGTLNERSKISTFLTSIINSGEPYAGIINADCLLLNYDRFVENLLRAVKDSIVLLERLNLDPETLRPTGRHCYGFDAFLFDTKFLRTLKQDNSFVIGEPYWDYWFPLSMMDAGALLKTPAAPVMLHINHQQNWRLDKWRENGEKVTQFLLSQERKKTFDQNFMQSVEMVAFESKSKDERLNRLSSL